MKTIRRKIVSVIVLVCLLVASVNIVQAMPSKKLNLVQNKIKDIKLGNTSAKILNGGLSCSYEGLRYYATDEGIVLINGEDEKIISTDSASYINVINSKLYYTTYENDKYVIKVSDLFAEKQKIILESETEITMMYVVDGKHIVYLSNKSIHKLDIKSKKLKCEGEGLEVISFIPTVFGYIKATNNEGKYDLWIEERQIFTAESYYVDNDVLVVSVDYETYEIELRDLFSTDFNFELSASTFDMYGKITMQKMLISEEDAVDVEKTYFSEEYIEKDKKYLKKYGNENNFAPIATYATTPVIGEAVGNAAQVVPFWSKGQENIIKRARQMVEFKWTPLSNVSGWAGQTIFKKGVTYTGVPYGQCTSRGSWLGYGTSLDLFAKYINNSSSLLYTSTASNGSYISPYYSNDCSTFLSYCWGLANRKNTSNIPGVSNVTKITQSDNSVLQVGDCLNASGNHVILITNRVFNSAGELIGYDIMHQTPPKATKVSNVSLASIDLYFQSGYIAYRYDDRNNVTYEHCCSVPIDGDTCAECDYDASVATTMSLKSANKPASLNIGQSFSIKGVINSNYKIREVAVGVYTTSGKKVIGASATPWTNSYNIVDLDAKIKFGSLSAGTYEYKVMASDRKGARVLLSSTFVVSEPASTLSISSYTYPTTLSVGKSFSLRGAITSNYTITKVTIGVYTTSDVAKITASATPNSKSYNVSSLDAKIKFGSLTAGTYVYKVIATDTKGTKTLLCKTFTVK